ncbi:hypothetical protein IF650_19220 [Cellulosimicrobium terreum]|nr:hypothetical protein [Cellulosimicrobium terreum]
MSVTRFELTSSLSVPELMRVLTDFGPSRPQTWPTIDAEHFQVHDLGPTFAEVTEGTAASWERARYSWDVDEGRVDITTLDSKVFGPGGGWTFLLTPVPGGTRVDVELRRTPRGLRRKLLAALLPVVGPSSFRKSFAVPLETVRVA